MAERSQKHGKEMYHQQGAAPLAAMHRMQELVKVLATMQEWFELKK